MTENQESQLDRPSSRAAGQPPDVGVQIERYRGPLPSPEALARYDVVLPGAADRILQMAERRLEHRQRLESTVAEGSIVRARLGIIAATVVSLAVLGVAGYALYLGQPVAGGVLGVADVVGLSGVYIYGTRNR